MRLQKIALLHTSHWPNPRLPTITEKPARIIQGGRRYFYGENVVITGGGSPLGRALALKLVRLHASVAIWDTDREGMEETVYLAKNRGYRILSYICDVSRKEDIYRVAERTRREIGQVTVVINNTETASEKLLLDTPDSVVERTFRTNVLSHFWTAKAFLPYMVDTNKGHIVSISSMAAHVGIQKLTDFSASKAAIISFLQSLKTELQREGSLGVKTTVICPYFTYPSKLQHHAEFKFLSPLTVEEVASRIIKAISNKEEVVFIPGWLRLLMIPKWITPPFVASLLKRLLIAEPAAPSMSSLSKMMQLIRPAKKLTFRSAGPSIGATIRPFVVRASPKVKK